MFPAMVIPKDETIDWLHDAKSVLPNLEQAYRECIKSMLPNIRLDPRFLENDHIVNMEFNDHPVFLMGIKKGNASRPATLAVLYVFPEYRNQGIAKMVLEGLLSQTHGILQVAVHEDELWHLKGFYESLGFKTLNRIFKDDVGDGYCDFFWGPGELELVPSERGTLCRVKRPQTEEAPQ